VVVCVVSLTACGSALAESRSISKLRLALGQTFLAVRATYDPAVCSDATTQGRLSLIEMTRGQERYLPSTSCGEAFTDAQHEFVAGGSQGCGTVAGLKTFIKGAIVRVKGKRATIQLVDDIYCYTAELIFSGATAVHKDPMGVSHWIKRRGRWLFDNSPRGTYSPAGMRSAALLRAALSGGRLTQPSPGLPDSAVSFCATGASTMNYLGNFLPERGPWYVSGGYSLLTNTAGAPFDAQGDPQGAVFVYEPSAEWDIALVGGKLVASSPAFPAPAVLEPGAAGC
jgi:hypothetical protein